MPHGASIRPRRQTPAPGYAIQLLGRLRGSKYRDIPSAKQLIRQQKLNTGGREKRTHASGVLRDAHGGSAGAQRRMREWPGGAHFLPGVFFWCSKGWREEEGREQLRRSPFFRRFSPSNDTGAGPLRVSREEDVFLEEGGEARSLSSRFSATDS